MACTSKLCRSYNAPVVSRSRAHEKNDSATFRNARHYFGSTSKVCCCDVEGDDVDTFADTVDVARICGVPERCGVA